MNRVAEEPSSRSPTSRTVGSAHFASQAGFDLDKFRAEAVQHPEDLLDLLAGSDERGAGLIEVLARGIEAAERRVLERFGAGGDLLDLLALRGLAANPGDAHLDPSEAETARRILVVEDEELVGTVIRIALERRGHEVSLVTDAARALALVVADPRGHDAVFLDLSLPGMPGRDLFERLQDAAPGIPVILMSGHAIRELGADEILSRAAGFVAKPFRPADLVLALDRALARP